MALGLDSVRSRLLDFNHQTPGLAPGLSSKEEMGGTARAVFRYHNVGARGEGGLETVSMHVDRHLSLSHPLPVLKIRAAAHGTTRSHSIHT